LDLRTREGALKGGKRGPALTPGKPEQSLLYQAVARSGALQMPLGKPALAAAEVEALRRWIAAGAAWGEIETWWAFRPPRKPGGDIDSLWGRRGPRADRRTLVRRAYFDLHGLPPPPEEVEAFVQDQAPDAWARLIDRLLASPRYGERWGRHWLDVVRYADTGGFETDIYFPNAWRYRDYVIKSFNDDKPYDRFVQEQIAGDEIWRDNLDLAGGYGIPKEKREHLEARIGTALYNFGPVEHEAALDGNKLRYEWWSEAVDTTGAAFLGLTIACARCHDHKLDPIPQRDYYRLAAMFAASEQREIPVVDQMAVFGFYTGYPRLIAAEQAKAAVQRHDQKERQKAIDALKKKFSPEAVEAFDTPKEKRTDRQKELAYEIEVAVKEIQPTDSEERRALIYELGEAYLKAPNRFATATVLGPAEIVHDVHIALRGDLKRKGEKVEPGFPAALGGGEASGSERRKALALWLTRRDHPLTARVMVNRIWQGHFGRGLVATANDFGRQGEPPSHPELLDWLAVTFIEKGWSIKAMHRLILMSEAYQSVRERPQRLEAEAVRDAILAAAGTLNTKMGGPPVVPPLTAEEMEGMWNPGQWPVTLDEQEQRRRSVYFYVKRSFRYPLFEIFDQPDTSVSCPRREATTVAPQALALLNNPFVHAQARLLAERVKGEADPAGVMWKQALGRAPSEEERRKAEEFARGRLEDLALALFNLNEFLYVD
jgi:hypothetical protein